MAKIKKFKKAPKGKKPGMQPVPPDKYLVVIDKAEIKESQAGNDYLALTYKIQKGEYKGRLIFDNLSLWHDREDVQEINAVIFQSLSEAALGKIAKDTSDLEGAKLVLKTRIKKDKEHGDKAVPSEYLPAGKVSGKKKKGDKSAPWN